MSAPATAVGCRPLLVPARLDAPLAWRGGRAVTGRAFLADAAALAERLPGQGAVVNLCGDRYRFAVGFAAALLRGRTSLLPPNALPATLAQLAGHGTPLVGVCDHADLVAPGVPLLRIDADGSGAQPFAGADVPCIAEALPAASLLTSGSTGAPQPHGKTWGALALNIGAEAERLAELLELPTLHGLSLVATVPAQHSYGFESSVLLALLGGAAFECGQSFWPADIAAALARLPRPRALVTTPFHLKTLLAAGVALPRCDGVVSATAPLSPQLALAAERALGAPLVEIYGCTEAGQVATRRTVQGDVWTTFGALRLQPVAPPGDAADAAAPPRHAVRGGHVVEETPLADVLDVIDARHFRLLGRAGDIVNVGGKRSSLAHLDFHLNAVEGVDDGAFWMPPDVADGVVRPVAFVVAPTLGTARIAAALRQRIEPAFVPRRIVRLDALPRAATGKLTAEALARLARLAREHGIDGSGHGVDGGGHGGATSAVASGPDRPAGSGSGAVAGMAAASAGDTGEPAPVALAASVRSGVADAAPVPSGVAGGVAADPAGPARGPYVVSRDVPADHPAFAGHFPGRPILPGALLLAEVFEALAAAPALAAALGACPTVAAAKFLAPVGPASRIDIALTPAGAAAVGFEVRCGATLVASGRLVAAEPAA